MSTRTFFAAVLCAWGGCGDNTDPAAVWCGGLCEATQRCEGINQIKCVSDCVRERPGLLTLSDQGLKASAPCLATLSCAAIGGDEDAWDSEMDACWEEAKRTVQVPPQVRALCVPYTHAVFQCGSWFSTAQCERTFSMFGDPVINLLQACLYQTACEPLDRCVDSVFNAL